MTGPLKSSSCSPVRLRVRLVFDAFEAPGLVWAADGSAQVGDGVSPVLKVETVTRGVQAVDGCQPVEMVLPSLVSIEGIDASSHTPRYMVYWPVPVEGTSIIVRVDGPGRVAVDFAVDGQVAVSGDSNPLGGGNGVVEDRLGVRVGRGQQFGEHAAARRPVPLLGSDVF